MHYILKEDGAIGYFEKSLYFGELCLLCREMLFRLKLVECKVEQVTTIFSVVSHCNLDKPESSSLRVISKCNMESLTYMKYILIPKHVPCGTPHAHDTLV